MGEEGTGKHCLRHANGLWQHLREGPETHPLRGVGEGGWKLCAPNTPPTPTPDGLLSYTAPVGQTMYLSEAVHLNDSTYDGYTTHAVGG